MSTESEAAPDWKLVDEVSSFADEEIEKLLRLDAPALALEAVVRYRPERLRDAQWAGLLERLASQGVVGPSHVSAWLAMRLPEPEQMILEAYLRKGQRIPDAVPDRVWCPFVADEGTRFSRGSWTLAVAHSFQVNDRAHRDEAPSNLIPPWPRRLNDLASSLPPTGLWPRWRLLRSDGTEVSPASISNDDYSPDLAAFAAFCVWAFAIRLRQGIAATGRIDAATGRVEQVEGVAAKSWALRREAPWVRVFVVPTGQKEEVPEALRDGPLDVIEVETLAEVEAIVRRFAEQRRGLQRWPRRQIRRVGLGGLALSAAVAAAVAARSIIVTRRNAELAARQRALLEQAANATRLSADRRTATAALVSAIHVGAGWVASGLPPEPSMANTLAEALAAARRWRPVAREVSIDDQMIVAAPSFSPDGRRLAVPARTLTWIVDTTTGEVLRRLPIGHVRWAPSGRFAVTDHRLPLGPHAERSGFTVLDSTSFATICNGEDRFLEFSPNGEELLSHETFVSGGPGPFQELRIRRAETCAISERLRFFSALRDGFPPAFDPANHRVLVSVTPLPVDPGCNPLGGEFRVVQGVLVRTDTPVCNTHDQVFWWELGNELRGPSASFDTPNGTYAVWAGLIGELPTVVTQPMLGGGDRLLRRGFEGPPIPMVGGSTLSLPVRGSAAFVVRASSPTAGVIVTDLATGENRLTIPTTQPSASGAVGVSGDGSHVATATVESIVRVDRISDWPFATEIPSGSGAPSVFEFSPDASTLLVGYRNEPWLLDWAVDAAERVYSHDPGRRGSVWLSQHGGRVLRWPIPVGLRGTVDERTAEVLDAETGRRLALLEQFGTECDERPGFVRVPFFDESYVACVGTRGRFSEWDLSRSQSGPREVSVTPRHPYWAVSSREIIGLEEQGDHTIVVQQRDGSPPFRQELRGRLAGDWTASRNGGRVAVELDRGNHSEVEVWDLNRHLLLANVPGHGYSTVLSSDGNQLALASRERTWFFRVEPFDQGWSVDAGTGGAIGGERLVFAPAGQFVAVAPSGLQEDRSVAVIDINQRRIVARLRGHQGVVATMRFSTDGNRVGTLGDDQTLRVWDPRTGTAIMVIKLGLRPQDFAFLPDARRVAVQFEHEVRVYRIDLSGLLELACAHARRLPGSETVHGDCEPSVP